MHTDYASIEKENVRRYGEAIGEYGELFFSYLYSDRTHFVYELLQNAEDALHRRTLAFPSETFPRAVSFRLHKDRLELSHHGILFNEADVRGICGILRGTKVEDLTQIGKFGIGFKSVYAYAATPRIHSGNEHFFVRDFVKPQELPTAELAPGETLFILRFDRADVPKETAFHEIAARLEGLNLRTLIFLREIDQINWEIEDRGHGTYLRKSQSLSQTARKVVLYGPKGEDGIGEEWLVFQRSVRTDQGNDLPVEIAFLLQKPQKAGLQAVAALIESDLVVFFPTDKETHVGFLIQGPYRTTLSRDNVPADDPWNSKLVSETATLLVDSLISLRDMGLMNAHLLEALPIRKDDFPESFMLHPLFAKVREALRGRNLLPTSAGSYKSAPRLKMARPTGLCELVSTEQLTRLYGANEPLDWLHEELSSDRNASLHGYLTDELEIEVVTPSDVARLLSEEFLKAQTDDWMVQFYRFLNDQEALWREGTRWKASGPLRSKPIIRLEDGEHVAPFTDDNHPRAYLPSEHRSYFPTIKRNIAEDKEVLAFLQRLGLRKPDTTAEVLEHVAPRYVQPARWRADDETLLEDLKLIVEAWRTDSTEARAKLRKRLQACYFIPTVNPVNGESLLAKPAEAYFPTINLETYFSGSESVRFIQRVLPQDLDKEFEGLLGGLGVVAEPRRIEFEPDLSWKERLDLRGGRGSSRQEVLKDYDLDGLHAFIDGLSTSETELAIQRSKILWDFLRAHENEYQWFRGVYSWFYYSPWSADFPAKFLKSLQERPWLPGRDGKLNRPVQLALNDLPDGFETSPRLAEHLGMKPGKLAEIAAQLNVDEEALALLREHAEEWKQFVKQLQQASEAREAVVASQTDQSGVEAGSGHPVYVGESDADANPSAERPTEDADEDGLGDSDSGQAEERQKRLPVIVATGETRVREPHSSAGPDEAVDRAGIDSVLRYEIENGRQPEEMPHSNKGFDIRSWDPIKQVMRIIEVKSLSGSWSEANVALSSPQFEHGTKEEPGQEYWLYVVERAGREDARLFCIPNPARKVTHFIYPAAWKRLGAD